MGGIGLVLAVVKVAVIASVLRLRLGRATWAVLPVTLLALFGLPGVFRELARVDGLTHGFFHGAWWLAGLLLAGQAVGVGNGPRVSERDGVLISELRPDPDAHPLEALRRTLRWVLPGLLWASVVAHLAAAHWVFLVPWTTHDAAPLFLGGAVLLLRQRLPRETLVQPALAAIVLSAAAIGLAAMPMSAPADLILDPWASPLRLTLAGTATVMLIALLLRRGGAATAGDAAVLAVGATSLAVIPMGATPAAIWGRLSHRAVNARTLMPDSTLEWGVIGVTAAFGLLIAGGWKSVRGRG